MGSGHGQGREKTKKSGNPVSRPRYPAMSLYRRAITAATENAPAACPEGKLLPLPEHGRAALKKRIRKIAIRWNRRRPVPAADHLDHHLWNRAIGVGLAGQNRRVRRRSCRAAPGRRHRRKAGRPMTAPVNEPLKVSLNRLKSVVLAKYGISCASATISPAVTPITASVGIKCRPCASCTGNNHTCFWSFKMSSGAVFQVTGCAGSPVDDPAWLAFAPPARGGRRSVSKRIRERDTDQWVGRIFLRPRGLGSRRDAKKHHDQKSAGN